MKPANSITLEQYRSMRKGKSKYNVAAKENRTADGILFDSRGERDLYLALKPLAREGAKLLVHARMPLWSSAPSVGKMESYINVDFVLVDVKVVGARGMRYAIIPIEAWDYKPARYRSREWARGASAFHATYGIPIRTVDKVSAGKIR